MSRPATAAVEQPSPTAITAIAAIVGTVALGVLVQAVHGGIFAREKNHKGLIDGHQGIAYLLALVALAAVVVAFVSWRARWADPW